MRCVYFLETYYILFDKYFIKNPQKIIANRSSRKKGLA